MEKFLQNPLPEIVLTSADPRISQAIRRAVLAGRLRKIAPRIYTSNFDDPPDNIIARHRYFIIAKLFPHAVISHRSALEGGFASDHSIVLTYKYTKNIKLPGMLVRLVKGEQALSDDTQFLEGLAISSRARAFLENLQPSRSRAGLARTLPKNTIEQRLDKLARVYGIDELNRIRDTAKRIAPQLNFQKEYIQLEKMIAALLGTHDIHVLESPIAQARAKGFAYDPYRLELFSTLAAHLSSKVFEQRVSILTSMEAKRHFAFFESYFSNFIEGTEFEIEEAEKIIFQNKIIANRSDDSHDILGTYKIVANQAEMKITPDSPEMFIKLLKHRHAILLEARIDKKPGYFKDKINRAGNTVFVKPDEVIGTLNKGFELYSTMEQGLTRAIFMMFLVSEVHPFLDGNGKIARVMMNAELVASNQCKILIPTVYREDYLLAIRKLSRQNDPAPYTRMLERAQHFSAAFDYSHYETILKNLKKANAFSRSDEAKLKFP